MEITLDKAGFLARYYEWTFKKEVPNWLCPYFWVIVFLVVLFPVVLFMKLIIYLIKKFKSNPQTDEEWEKNYLKRLKVEDIMISIGIVVLILFCIFGLGFLGYTLISLIIKHGFLVLLKVLGILSIVFGFCFLLVIGFDKLIDKIAYSKTSSIIIGMIKSLYHKVCPHINWVDSRKTNDKNSENG
jgi:MFS family permease